MSTKKVVITGITSGLGISLAQLLVSKGYFVLGISRHAEKAKKILTHDAIELRSGDILDPEFVRSVCSEASGIIHLAALSSPWGRYRDFYATNVDGTRRLTHAALEAQVPRFVHVSTPSLYFDYRDRLGVSERDLLPRRGVNAYARTKKMAENVVDEAQREGLSTITIRPRAIFGPHDQTLFPRILKACQEKGIPRFRKKSPLIDVTYVDNVAHALYLALEAPMECVGQKYHISNGEPLPLWTLLEDLLDKLSIASTFRRIPYPIAFCAAYLAEIVGHLVNREPSFTRYSVGVMAFSQTLNIQKAQLELGYQPIVSLSEGIQRYVTWLKTS